jgi:acylphosphatase
VKSSAQVAMRLKIAGIVHGVSFRATMARVAEQHRVRGWVRNMNDGTVEAFLEGNEAAVLRVTEWARRGPPRAVVKRVEARRVVPQNFRDFRIEA